MPYEHPYITEASWEQKEETCLNLEEKISQNGTHVLRKKTVLDLASFCIFQVSNDLAVLFPSYSSPPPAIIMSPSLGFCL